MIGFSLSSSDQAPASTNPVLAQQPTDSPAPAGDDLTITLTNRGGTGQYTLDTELFLAPPFNNFISGQGVPLDDSITTLGAATVHVLHGEPDPQITRFIQESNATFRIQFADPFGVPILYQIQRTVDVGNAVSWAPLSDAAIIQLSPGHFEARWNDGSGLRFYRVMALYRLD